MLKMRLQRVGRKHEPSFRLVLTDSKNSTKSGRFNEILGSFDPRKSTEVFKVDRIKHWLSMGVSATGTVHNLLVTHKIIDEKKINVLPKKTPIVKEALVEEVKPEVTAAPTPAAEETAHVEESATAVEDTTSETSLVTEEASAPEEVTPEALVEEVSTPAKTSLE